MLSPIILRQSLTSVKTPTELLRWLDSNVAYNGVNKGRVWTPVEVVRERKGHCWETAELAAVSLRRMGFECEILYIQSKGCVVTHSTVIYCDGKGHWYWFEWAWSKAKGVHGPYRSRREAVVQVINAFAADNGRPEKIRIGPGGIVEGRSELDYIQNVDSWTNVDSWSM